MSFYFTALRYIVTVVNSIDFPVMYGPSACTEVKCIYIEYLFSVIDFMSAQTSNYFLWNRHDASSCTH